MLLLAGFSIISVPLVEAPQGGGDFYSYLIPSALAIPPALLVMYLLWYLTFRNGDQPVWMLFAIASISGLTRGTSLYFAGEVLGTPEVELPSLLARVITAVTTWNLTLASFAIINYLVLSPTEKWYGLRRDLLELDEEIKDSKLQLQWLVNRKVKGLEQELRQEFLLLSNTMRSQASSPEQSYAELAKALRGFASRSVRDRSRKIWEDKSEKTPLTQAAIRAITKNPLALSSTFTYLLGYLINEIRVYGVSFGLMPLVIGNLTFFLLLLAGRVASKRLENNLLIVLGISLAQGLISALVYSLFLSDRSTSYVISTSVAASLWSLASLFIAGWLNVSIELYATEIKELSEKRALSETELAWLEAQLSSTNREIAKYLHGILQSRLMAHALSLDGKDREGGKDISTILDDLERVMAKPMDAFLDNVNDINSELSKISTRWEGFVDVKIDKLDITSDQATEPTLQLLQEALSNAFSHGGATRARIQILDSATFRQIVIEDNGQLQDGPAGLGSEILTSITQGNWSIAKTPEGSTLTAVLQFGKAFEAAP